MKYFKSGLWFVVLWLAAGIAIADIDDRKVIFNMGDKEYPPYMFFDENGNANGIMYDVLQAFANKQGYMVVPVKMSKKRVRVSLEHGKLDATPRAIEWEANPNRYVFTSPIILQRDVLFSLLSQPVDFSRVEELKTHTIILRKGYIYPTLADLVDNKLIQVMYTNSEENMLNMLRYERAKAAVISEFVGLWLIKQQKAKGIFYVSKGAIDEVAYRIMFTKPWAEFVQLFNQELVSMKKEGRVVKIVNKYIGM
ncbi:transporter substrate-binding domain-containing protein [Endozoicomonas sp. SM1973]|uniref:Transporter substrate-binding domain-containing protein n=1 Tax=Spartinivicinus marinus TaxID=2994442 RepID=A0A853II63_9GAMM|nr:transporter substrate-binding domain-containing protein [Spartinivicinus marinus]MCX4028684.1 transporter substrate-binding domain-containing protein [Spartinivicinus marinus]NYZ69097.1 transporter substrate-binding domain-containing protein [Spartinivicinus marinus]